MEQLPEPEYVLVYFHHGLRRTNRPALRWLQDAYGELGRRSVRAPEQCSVVRAWFSLGGSLTPTHLKSGLGHSF